jgi:hypothetical protein
MYTYTFIPNIIVLNYTILRLAQQKPCPPPPPTKTHETSDPPQQPRLPPPYKRCMPNVTAYVIFLSIHQPEDGHKRRNT